MCPHGRSHRHHLTNTTEPSVCRGNAVLCQITTLTSCFFLSLIIFSRLCCLAISFYCTSYLVNYVTFCTVAHTQTHTHTPLSWLFPAYLFRTVNFERFCMFSCNIFNILESFVNLGKLTSENSALQSG